MLHVSRLGQAFFALIHSGLAMPYGGINGGQTIIWNNVGVSSVEASDIDSTAFSQEILYIYTYVYIYMDWPFR